MDKLNIPVYCLFAREQNLPFLAPGRPSERKALHYFFNFASLDLAGYVLLGFWDRLVLQLVQVEPTVRQAVIAVGLAHLDTMSHLNAQKPAAVHEYENHDQFLAELRIPPDMATALVQSKGGIVSKICAVHDSRNQSRTTNHRQPSFETLEAYQKAIIRLRKYIAEHSSPSHLVVLVCCMLFYSFENLYGSHEGADVHLDNGVRIIWNTTCPRRLREGSVRLRADQAVEKELRMFTFVLLQIETADRHSDQKLISSSPQSLEEIVSPADAHTFSSAGDATPSFLHIVQACHDFLKRNAALKGTWLAEAPKTTAKEFKQIICGLRVWQRKVGEYADMYAKATQAVLLHEVGTRRAHIAEMINTQVIRCNHLIIYDSMASYFVEIAESHERAQIGRDLLNAAARGFELQKEFRELCDFELRGSLSTHTEIIDTLYLFAYETPSSEARAEALDLIRKFDSL